MKFFHLVILCFTCTVLKSQQVKVDTIIGYGKQYLGTKYRYGQSQPKKGFDCSGFVYYVYRNFNIEVPRASMDYEKLGHVVNVDSCLPGDVIVFTGTKLTDRRPGHVGIILSKSGEEVTFMHSSSGKKANGVIVTNFTQSPYYQKRFIKVIRLDQVAQ